MKAIAVVGLLIALSAGCSRSDEEPAQGTGGEGLPTTTAQPGCDGGTPLEATEVGVTPETITIQVSADVGSPLAPGLFQGNIDALEGFEDYVNANGGVGCRELVVETWDSRLDPAESKNALIVGCKGALALVGGNMLFNPETAPMDTCVDQAGAPTGLPNLTALASDSNEQCSPMTYSMQAQAETCPVVRPGERPIRINLGYWDYLQTLEPELAGAFLVPGDLPSSVEASTPQIISAEEAGIEITEAVKVSGRAEQAAYTPIVQALKSNPRANFLYNGSSDSVMVNMRREAAAQGLDQVTVWACSLACYTDAFRAAGSAVDGTYVAMPFLPFEEREENAELANYLDHVETPSSFGAQAWQAAVLFTQVIDEIVATNGPNAITRANMLEVLDSIDTFDANGWAAPKPLKGVASCGVFMQLRDGEFQRAFPTEPGTFDCTPDREVVLTIDPAAEASKLR